jgi:thiaminase
MASGKTSRGIAIEEPELRRQRFRARMLAAFTRATQYEWLFWDGAYELRAWPSVG